MGRREIDQTKVFISSAMEKADDGIDDVDWPGLRESVYEALKDDEQFCPFAIERETSSQPSTQFFLNQVEQTDFVVCMVGKELRGGTKREIDYAFEKQKKVLIYFIGNEQVGRALELKQNLQRSDACCFHVAKTQVNLPEVIVANLKSELSRLVRGLNRQDEVEDDKPALIEYMGLPSTTFGLFGHAGDVLLTRLGIRVSDSNVAANETSPLETLGKDAICWLFDNKPFSLAVYEDAIRKSLPALTEAEERLGLRAACGSAIHGDVRDAYSRLKKSLEGMGPSDEWQCGVALVELRNYATRGGDIKKASSVQARIDALSSSVIFPPYEHCLYRADEMLRDVEQWKRGLSVTSRGYNNSYIEVVRTIADALFVAVIYGNFTRMNLARNYLARSLVELARIYNEPSFAFHALRLAFVGGDGKIAHGICDHDWPLVANVVPANADTLWKAACLCNVRGGVASRCDCIELLAPYFSENTVIAIRAFLAEKSTKQTDSNRWAKAMRSISMRLDSDMLVDSLSGVLESEDINSRSCVGTLLGNIVWDKVGDSRKSRFSAAFSEHWQWYLECGGSAEILAHLINDGVLPADLSSKIEEAINGLSKAAFHGALQGWASYSELFEEAVAIAEDQLKTNSSGTSFAMFSNDPYWTMMNALRDDGVGLLKTPTGDRLFSLFVRATKTKAPDEALSSMLETMVLCASLLICAGDTLPPGLVEAAKTFRQSSSSISFYTFGGSTAAAWKVRLAALRAVCGVGRIDEALSIYLSARDDYETASAFGRLIPYLLRAFRAMGGEELQALALVLSELAMDIHPEVRRLVPEGAVELLDTAEHDYGYRLLELLLKDTDPTVRLAVLHACADSRIEDRYRAMVQDLLSQDANYHLRHHAEKQRLASKRNE